MQGPRPLIAGPGRIEWIPGGRLSTDEAITRATQITITGRDRVRAVRACVKLHWTETACDGVVLNGSPRPNRNVTGALADESPGVTFIQPLAASITERSEIGRRAARNWIAANGGAD